jgi:hypothetical protein
VPSHKGGESGWSCNLASGTYPHAVLLKRHLLLYQLEFDNDNKVLCTVFEGRYSFADFLSSGEATHRLIMEKNPVARIWDFSKVTHFDIRSVDIYKLADTFPIYPPGVSRFVVASSDYVYGRLRMWRGLGENISPELQVVRTRKEAYQILGLPGMKLERI